MTRDPHRPKTPQDAAGVWFARIRGGSARRATAQGRRDGGPLLRQRLAEAAAAAAEAASTAASAAAAADRAAGLAELMDAFGRRGGIGPDELRAAAEDSIEAAVGAREGGARASTQGQLARLAAQDEAAATEPEVHRHAGLGELWHE